MAVVTVDKGYCQTKPLGCRRQGNRLGTLQHSSPVIKILGSTHGPVWTVICPGWGKRHWMNAGAAVWRPGQKTLDKWTRGCWFDPSHYKTVRPWRQELTPRRWALCKPKAAVACRWSQTGVHRYRSPPRWPPHHDRSLGQNYVLFCESVGKRLEATTLLRREVTTK